MRSQHTASDASLETNLGTRSRTRLERRYKMDRVNETRPVDLRQIYARLAEIGRERLAAVEQAAPLAVLQVSVSVATETPGETMQQAATSER